MDRVPMTALGFEKLRQRLDHLKNVERPRIEKALGEAREQGDLSENSEYDAAREELWRVDQRILEFEDRLSRAQVVDNARIDRDSIALGAKVTVEDLTLGRRDQFLVVGEGETRDGIDTVSVASPLGQALIGHKVGDTVEFQAPRGKLKFKVLEIQYE